MDMLQGRATRPHCPRPGARCRCSATSIEEAWRLPNGEHVGQPEGGEKCAAATIAAALAISTARLRTRLILAFWLAVRCGAVPNYPAESPDLLPGVVFRRAQVVRAVARVSLNFPPKAVRAPLVTVSVVSCCSLVPSSLSCHIALPSRATLVPFSLSGERRTLLFWSPHLAPLPSDPLSFSFILILVYSTIASPHMLRVFPLPSSSSSPFLFFFVSFLFLAHPTTPPWPSSTVLCPAFFHTWL